MWCLMLPDSSSTCTPTGTQSIQTTKTAMSVAKLLGILRQQTYDKKAACAQH
jgi:hypothetical protein